MMQLIAIKGETEALLIATGKQYIKLTSETLNNC